MQISLPEAQNREQFDANFNILRIYLIWEGYSNFIINKNFNKVPRKLLKLVPTLDMEKTS